MKLRHTLIRLDPQGLEVSRTTKCGTCGEVVEPNSLGICPNCGSWLVEPYGYGREFC